MFDNYQFNPSHDRVLLIDVDSPPSQLEQELLEKKLNDLQCKVDVVKDTEEAVEKLKSNNLYHLLFVNLTNTEIKDKWIIRETRKFNYQLHFMSHINIPLIVITNHKVDVQGQSMEDLECYIVTMNELLNDPLCLNKIKNILQIFSATGKWLLTKEPSALSNLRKYYYQLATDLNKKGNYIQAERYFRYAFQNGKYDANNDIFLGVLQRRFFDESDLVCSLATKILKELVLSSPTVEQIEQFEDMLFDYLHRNYFIGCHLAREHTHVTNNKNYTWQELNESVRDNSLKKSYLNLCANALLSELITPTPTLQEEERLEKALTNYLHSQYHLKNYSPHLENHA